MKAKKIMPDNDVVTQSDMLNKLSTALIQVSRGDPLVALRNELATEFKAIDVRFNAIDEATKLQHEDAVRVPTLVDKAISGLRDLLEQRMSTHVAQVFGELHRHVAETQEKFVGVGSQFTERDTRTDQRAGDTKLAVDAAFAAAKEATAKIEAGFTKQIDAMVVLIDTKTANLANQITDIKDNLAIAVADIKDRLTTIESRAGTVTEVRKDSRDNMSLLVAFAAVLIALGAAYLHR